VRRLGAGAGFGVDTDLGYPTGTDVPVWKYDGAYETTRWMCSRVLVDRGRAERVFEQLCVPHVRPVAPAPGIDLVAVARHAAWAIRDERRVAAVASLLLGGALLALAAAVLAVGGGSAGTLWQLPLLAAALLVGAAIAWRVNRTAQRAEAARRVFSGLPVDAPEVDLVIDPTQMRRLHGANHGTLLVYDEQRSRADEPASTVFPGYGRLAGFEVRVPVDVSQAVDTALPLGQVKPYELLRHLARTVPAHIDCTEIIEESTAVVVAHVLASDASASSDVVDGAGGPVRSEAPADFLRRAADAPTRGVRSYVRAQVVGHGGHLVTTLHVSAVAGTTGLSLNFLVHVLGPLHPSWAAARDIPATPWGRRWRVGTQGQTWARLAEAPYEWLRLHRLLRRARRVPWVDAGYAPRPARRRRTAAGPYGARGGLRWTQSHLSGLRFNEVIDLKRQANDLMRALFSETKAFLEARNISAQDLREDERQALQAVSNNITNVIGAVISDVTVGGDLHASVTGVVGST
jgi:hypothetical protein